MQTQMTCQQAFDIIDAICSRTAFTLTPYEFFQFADAMQIIKLTCASSTDKDLNDKN
ncbi:MAG: hypothetical protein ACK5DE_02215 [Bacteroidota bacterium]|jgi:hypothetical protein